MIKPLPVCDIDPFDLEGVLFIEFPTEVWLNGKARALLDAMVRSAGYDTISPFTIFMAFHHARRQLTDAVPPWRKERMAIEAWEERRVRLLEKFGIKSEPYKPYWKENGGTHTPGETKPSSSAWSFGEEEPASENPWSFNAEDEHETRTSPAPLWDFGTEDAEKSQHPTSSSAVDGWQF